MRINIIALCTLLVALLPAIGSHAAKRLSAGNGEETFVNFEVRDISLSDDASTLNISLSADLSQAKMRANYESTYTPMFVRDNDTIRFESFSIMGRNRYYYHQRNDASLPEILFYKGELQGVESNKLQGDGWQLFFNPDTKVADFTYTTPYQQWMSDAYLIVGNVDKGCANCPESENEGEETLAQTSYVVETFQPEYLYITPVAEAVKMREIAARAYIDFPVNKTEIYPDYRRNPMELNKIRNTIDSVRNDKDITVKSLHISGTASPEGSYQNNVRLAKGRTEALKNYVQKQYSFPFGFITTSYEPVDWKGLKEFLQQAISTNTVMELPHAAEILAIVDGDLEPYARNQKIKTTYPKEYTWLLQNVYPSLRHSDYKIDFEIKTFTEVSEIIEVLQTQPQKLSLAELFVAANSQPVGSDLYNKAFETAVVLFPNDETANFNAGMSAMERGDLETAAKYFEKAGDTPESQYAKALMALVKGEEEQALEIFKTLSNSSNAAVAAKASAAASGLEHVRSVSGFRWNKN